MAEPLPIAFLGVARLKDQAVLATCIEKNVLNEEKKGYDATLASVLERAVTAYPGWRDRSDCRDCDGILYSLVDTQALFLVCVGVRSSQYPERIAIQMLRELADKVRNSQGDELLSKAQAGSLMTPLRKLMKDVMKSYSDPGAHDKTSEVQQKVEQLKDIMQDNVRKILETHVSLEALENSSSSMSTQANRFLRQSVDLRRQIQFRNLKVKVLFGACILAVGLYVALPFIKT